MTCYCINTCGKMVKVYSEGQSSHKMMTRIILVLCFCLLLIELANSLKCRTSAGVHQQTNDLQYQKIMQICKKRSTTENDDYSNSDSSSEEEENDDSYTVDLFGTKFYMSGGSKFPNTQPWNNPNENRNRGNDQRNSNDRRYSVNYTNGNGRNGQYPPRSSNNRDFNYYDGAGRPNYDQMYNDNFGNYGKQQEQVCITQCFFNELNMVDQRGFPEQNSIIQFMTRNIRNSELQDFIEEAVIECVHYLNSDMRQNNKCYYSENLLTCLIEKGKERCEDWDDYK